MIGPISMMKGKSSFLSGNIGIKAARFIEVT